MADKPKFKFSAHVSPVGMAKYAWLTKPDTRFAKGDDTGNYKLNLLIEDTPENREWIEERMALAVTEAKKAGVKIKKGHKVPFTYPEDVDEEDFVPDPETGKAKYDEDWQGKIFCEIKSKYKPGLIDTTNKELPKDIYPMSGDMVRVKFVLEAFEGLGSGYTLKLKTVQLVQKNTTFSGVDTGGFDEIDGYVAGAVKPANENEDEDF